MTDDGPITVPYEQPTEEQRAYWEQQAALGEQITQWESHLRQELENARFAVSAELAGDLTTLDADRAAGLAGQLYAVAGDARSAQSGLQDGIAAVRAFQGVEYWMHAAAGKAGQLGELGVQECHAQLTDVLGDVDNASGALAQA